MGFVRFYNALTNYSNRPLTHQVAKIITKFIEKIKKAEYFFTEKVKIIFANTYIYTLFKDYFGRSPKYFWYVGKKKIYIYGVIIGLVINLIVLATTTSVNGILFLLGLSIDLFAIPLVILLYVIIGNIPWFGEIIREWLVNNFLIDALFYIFCGIITYRLSANIANKIFSNDNWIKSCKILGIRIYKILRNIVSKTKNIILLKYQQKL